MGRAELRAAHHLQNTSEISDEFLVEQIRAFSHELENYIGYEPDYSPGSPGYSAVRYYGLIRAAFFLGGGNGPRSISHALRFDYDNTQLTFWRDRLIRALNQL
jgi:hypothetical protein